MVSRDVHVSCQKFSIFNCSLTKLRNFCCFFSSHSSLQQGHILVILQVCQNILPAKSLMQKYGMKKQGGDYMIQTCPHAILYLSSGTQFCLTLILVCYRHSVGYCIFWLSEICRQVAAGSKGQRHNLERRGSRESRAVPAPDANAELISSMQVTYIIIVTDDAFIPDGWWSWTLWWVEVTSWLKKIYST